MPVLQVRLHSRMSGQAAAACGSLPVGNPGARR